MSYNDYMYAVDRSDEYLEHFGIKGMKWGVRKAKMTANAGNRAKAERKLDRTYRKAQKKLAKLEKRANNGSKYAKRAAALGAGAALAGGAAALGTSGIATAMDATRRIGGGAMKGVGGVLSKSRIGGVRQLGTQMTHLGRNMRRNGGSSVASEALDAWGRSTNIGKGVAAAGNNAIDAGLKGLRNSGQTGRNIATKLVTNDTVKNARGIANQASGISNNTIARVGAGALGAGLAAGAAYNAYRAATTKKAAAKAQQFRSEMNKAFAGTKYANGGNGSSSGSKKRRRR